jgi:hypothetical protein
MALAEEAKRVIRPGPSLSKGESACGIKPPGNHSQEVAPFILRRVPVELTMEIPDQYNPPSLHNDEEDIPNRTGFDSDFSHGDCGSYIEIGRVDNLDRATSQRGFLHLRCLEGVWLLDRTGRTDGCLGAFRKSFCGGERVTINPCFNSRGWGKLTSREDVQLLSWNLVESGLVGLEVLGQNRFGDMAEPIGEL